MGNGNTTLVSEINSLIDGFIKTPPEGTNSLKILSIEAKLMGITAAVRDLLEEDSPETLDMLKAYRDQVKELVEGRGWKDLPQFI